MEKPRSGGVFSSSDLDAITKKNPARARLFPEFRVLSGKLRLSARIRELERPPGPFLPKLSGALMRPLERYFLTLAVINA